MLINAWDPRQWTYLRNLPQKNNKKIPGINQCGEKGGWGGVLHTLRICGFEQFRTKKLKIKIRVFEN
jgi:hypothetical protein